MILLVHMLFGAALAAITPNPFLAVVLAFFGHYFLDIFPHIEYLDNVENSITQLNKDSWKQNAGTVAKVLADFWGGLLFIFLFSKNYPLIYLCALVAVIPDSLTVANSLFPNTPLKKHHQFHGDQIHYLTKQKKFPVVWRIATQLAAAVISIILLRL